MKKGFTLIELSIVLIIIGLLTGGAFQMLKVMQEKARATEAKQTLQSVKEAIIGFAINNNRLPTATEFTDMNLTGAGNIAIFYNSDTLLQNSLCSSSTTLLTTVDTNGVTTPNIGFVLAVAGENFNVQTGRIGNTVTFHQWNTPNIDDETAILNRPEPYDDLHTEVTLGELQATIDCQNNQFKVITNALPSGKVGTYYSINPTVSVANGKSPYTYDLIGLLPANMSYNSVTNTLSGTPTQYGNFPLILTATDSTNAYASKEIVLFIDNNGSGSTSTPSSAYQQCVDTCNVSHTGQNQAIDSCIKTQCKNL